MASKLPLVLLVVSFVIIIPSLVLTIIIGRRFNKTPDAYNKLEKNDPIDYYFSWILACLYIGFLILCGALLMFMKEKTSTAQLTSIASSNASRAIASGNVAK